MKTRVLIQQGQIARLGQQLWVTDTGCSRCCENTSTWDLHLAVPLIVAFYWRGVCFLRSQWTWKSALSIRECWRRWSLTSAWVEQWIYTSSNNEMFSHAAVQWSSYWMASVAGRHLQRLRGKWSKRASVFWSFQHYISHLHKESKSCCNFVLCLRWIKSLHWHLVHENKKKKSSKWYQICYIKISENI